MFPRNVLFTAHDYEKRGMPSLLTMFFSKVRCEKSVRRNKVQGGILCSQQNSMNFQEVMKIFLPHVA